MIEKVTSPLKIVTDELVLKRLTEQGIDKDYVEFWHDYAPRNKGKEYSPYAKFYRDLKSGRQLMVASGLPMVDAYGFKHDLIWRERNGILENGNNIFYCVIDKGIIRLITLSDQPTGLKKDDEGQYHPQLFIGSSEVKPNSPIPLILATDPTNSNYHDNVTLWHYDTICRRRIRIIEGRFKESWFIDKHPHGRVRVKHNTNGKLRLELGFAMDARDNPLKVTVIGDEEIIEASEFDKVIFPVEIGASATFYPDVSSGGASFDGYAGQLLDDTAWATIIGGLGNASNDTSDGIGLSDFRCGTSTLWQYLYRGIFLFDTQGLPDIITISLIVLSFHGRSKGDPSNNTPSVNIYSSAPASNTAIADGDYDSLGIEALSSVITYPAWDIADYNDFVLIDVNSDNFATYNETDTYINKAGVSKFGGRDPTYDVIGTEPIRGANLEFTYINTQSSDKGAGFKPKLVVTYILPPPRYPAVNFQDPGIV